MTGALIILLVTVSVGLLLYVYDLRYRRRHPSDTAFGGDKTVPEENDGGKVSEEDHGEICCGWHLVCDKPLSPRIDDKIEYYDDEELDRMSGRDADAYSEEEIEEIREVMMTLLPEDVPGWVRSLQLRGINFPSVLRDELFMLLDCK